MLMMSKGDLFTIDGPVQEGMTVSLSDFGLSLAAVVDPESPFADAVLNGKIQVGFLDASPFGWWFLNTGRGFVDACWAVARVPKDDLPVVRGVCEYVLDTLDPTTTKTQVVPPANIVVVNIHDHRILGFRMVGLKADSWLRMAHALLRHPADMPESKLAYWQRKYESRWYHQQDFAKARELLWVDTFE